MCRMMQPSEMINGGMMNGSMQDPVTHLLENRHTRFSPLEEESRLTCMSGMLAFARRPNEPINSMLARYETIRTRVAPLKTPATKVSNSHQALDDGEAE